MSHSWQDLRRYYAPHAGTSSHGLFDLVTAIEQSRYSAGLYGWTSVRGLIIGQTELTNPYDGPYLLISPQPAGQLEFRYFDTYLPERQWHRTVAPADAFQRLESFLAQLHWFPKT